MLRAFCDGFINAFMIMGFCLLWLGTLVLSLVVLGLVVGIPLAVVVWMLKALF